MAEENRAVNDNKHGFRYFSEPVLFLYAFAYMLQYPTVHQYVYSRFSEEKGFIYSYTTQTTECEYGTMNQTQVEAQQKVQSLTAHFTIYYHLMSILPSMIMNLFYGALSDHVGRRCIMTVVLICAVIESLTLLINISFKLPLWTIFFGNICAGLGGGLNGMFMLIIAYTADVTEEVDRSVRIGLIEASLFLGMTLSNFASGELIHHYGFAIPELIVVLAHLSAIFYIAFVLKSSRDDQKQIEAEKRSPLYIFYQQPINMWRTLTKERVNKGLLYLAIVVLVTGLTFIVSVHSIFVLYLLNRPFCWPAIDVGYIMGVYFLVLSVGTAFGMKVLVKVIPEWAMSLLGYAFSAGSFFYISFARGKADLYGAIVLRVFGGLPTAIFRGNISKSVKQNEQGAIFSVVTSIEMLIIMFGIFIFNTSYARLNDAGHPGLFFLVPACLIIIPFILAAIYWRQISTLNPPTPSIQPKQDENQNLLSQHDNPDEEEEEEEEFSNRK